MSAFVDDRKIPVGAGGELTYEQITPETDVIFIRPKMTFAAKSRAIDALNQLEVGQNAQFNLGAYQLALFKANALGWQGPSFTGTAFTEGNIDRLDPDHPVVAAALLAIAQRNPLGQPDPNAKSANGSTTVGAASSPVA